MVVNRKPRLEELTEIVQRHMRVSDVTAAIKQKKTIVVDAPSQIVLVYQEGEEGAVGVCAAWRVRQGLDFRPFIDDSDAAVIKVMENGYLERRLCRIPEVKKKRRAA